MFYASPDFDEGTLIGQASKPESDDFYFMCDRLLESSLINP
jgi:hypothetical protein